MATEGNGVSCGNSCLFLLVPPLLQVFGDEAMNYNVADVKLEDLGHAGEVVVTKEDSLLLHGKGEADAISARVKQIQAEIDETNSNYEKEKLQERLARLADGVAVIKVSGLCWC